MKSTCTKLANIPTCSVAYGMTRADLVSLGGPRMPGACPKYVTVHRKRDQLGQIIIVQYERF